MAKEITYTHTESGATIYAKAEPLDTGTWANGIIAMTEDGNRAGYYTADVSLSSAADGYTIFAQAGEDPADSDDAVAVADLTLAKIAAGQTVVRADNADGDKTATADSIADLNDFDPDNDTVAHVTLVDTTTTNTDMRGTDNANTTAPDNAGIAAIQAKTDNLPASPAATGDAMTLTSGERTSIAAAVWGATTRTLTAIADSTGVTTLLGRLTSDRAGYLDNIIRKDTAYQYRNTESGETETVVIEDDPA